MKKHIIRFTCLFISLLSSLIMYSQENLVSGSIITLNGDTIKGYLDDRNWEKNPNLIKFKDAKSAELRAYNPLQISAFIVHDEIYKSAIVKVDQSNSRNEMSVSPVFEFRTDTTFLLTLVQGSKSLYYYLDKYNQSNYYIYNNSNFELLEFKKFNRIHDSEDVFDDYKGHLVEEMNNRYIGQLKYYFQNCNIPESMYQHLTYNRESIQKIFMHYYNQRKKEKLNIKNKEKAKLEFGLVGGLCATKIEFSTSPSISTQYIAFDYLTKTNFNTHFSMAAGAYLNIVLPRNNGKWSVYNELLFDSYAFNGFYSKYTNSSQYQNKTFNFEYYYVKMNNMIRFKYPVGKFNCFANAGISNGFAFKEVNHAIVETKFYSEHTIVETKAIEDTRIYEQGLLFGLGLNYKKYSVEFRYEGGTGIIGYTFLGSSTSRYNMFLAYTF